MAVKFGSIEEARRMARRRLPAALYDYVEGGKEGEITSIANVMAFSRVRFNPRIGSGITRPDMSTTLLGRRVSMPLVIAPTGYIRVVHSDGELGAARAAAKAGVPIAISTVSGVPARTIVEANEDTWFQLYMMGGREGAAYAIEVARQAGCRVLVVTADTAAGAPTDRPYRPLPMKIDIGTILEFAPQAWNKPQWLWSLLCGGLVMRAPNAPRGADGGELSLSEAGRLITGTPPSWEDLAWVRAQWQGPLVVKGVLRVEDARRAVDIGADAISVSNHGGKTLDGASASISMLPAIAEAVGDQIEILLDGGVRRGADIARACALGAKAVLIGRPYLWGLAVAGQAGVSDILRVFRNSLSATMAQIGCPSIAALDRSWLRPLPDEALWNEVPTENYARFCFRNDE